MMISLVRRFHLAWRALGAIALLLNMASATGDDNPGARLVEGAGGVPLVVQEWGNPDGIPVLLLHGFSFGSVAFKHQVGQLEEELRLIAPDLRGHGLSGKPWTEAAYAGTEVWAGDISRIVAAYDLEKPLIVAWSFGGYVAVNYLRHCGSNCASGLMLVGSLAGIVPRPPPPDPGDVARPPMKGNARVDNYQQLFDNAEWLARVMSYQPPSDADLLEKQFTIVMMPPHVRRAMAGLALDNQDIAGDLRLPVMFVHGAKDTSVPAASVSAAVAKLANARSLSLPNVGHSPFAETPALFNQILLDFARTTRTP